MYPIYIYVNTFGNQILILIDINIDHVSWW